MLIFFDIDGTLLDDWSRSLPESAALAIHSARENGHICAVNTGRTGKLVEPDRGCLSDFDAFCMGCGTMITYRGETLFHKTFSPADSRDIIDGLYRWGIDAVLEGDRNNFNDSRDRFFTRGFAEFIDRFSDQGYGSFQEAPGRFDKFYAYVDDVEKMYAFQKEFEDRLDFVDRRQGFFEIMPKGCSKASGMRFLADRLGIPMEETAALGDSGNDIPMLRCAHRGIAMGNATEDVKKAADFVTTPIEKDGVWNALKWLGAI